MMWRRQLVLLTAAILVLPTTVAGQTNIFLAAYRGSLPSSPPTAVGAGDFDGDGDPEIVSTSTGSLGREISFCRWFGIDDPPPGVSCDSGRAGPTFPSALLVDDFDNDDQVDLLVSGASSGEVVFFKGTGDDDRIAPPSSSLVVGANPRALAAGAIDDDANLDVAVANEGPSESIPGSVAVLLGVGDGSFTLCRLLGAEFGTTGVALGDIDGDQRLDLAAANSRASTVSVWRGDGACNFTVEPTLDLGSTATDVALGDLDGDGDADLVTADNNDDRISVFPSRGDGTFGPAARYPVGTAPDRVLMGDLDEDGHLDVLVSNVRSGDLSLLRGAGDGTLAAARSFVAEAQPRAISLADMDDDGIADVVTAVEPEISQAAVLLNPGNGRLLAVEDLAAGLQPEGLASTDVDDDSFADLVSTSVDGNVSVFLAGAGGGFGTVRTVPIGGRLFGVVAADFNRDDLPDLAVTDREGDEIAVSLALGGGAFGPVERHPTAAEPSGIVSGDFNGDGRPDLATVAGGVAGQVSVLLQRSDGTFTPARNTDVESTPVGVGAADFDGDGLDDLVVANQASETVSVLKSRGNGSFTLTQTLPPAAVGQATAVALADFDQDGRSDFAVSDFGPSSENVRIFLGNGDATFAPGQAISVGNQPRALAARDFTGDQRVDLAVVNQTSNEVQVLVQGADGVLRNSSRSGGDIVSRMPVAVVAGDFDGDGRYDGATANNDQNSNNLSVLTNCTRDPECWTRTPFPGMAARRGDANGDGVATAADLVVVALEVGDGDGNRVEDIGQQGVPAEPGVDANGDGVVNSQDRMGVGRRLFLEG